ncbi:hypothetical protein FRP1_28765 (plasmid) [Pseudonocardia sp. EC080625-04]|uniref:hypothetical protein n=1 Tax=Pseudonocardia sp. EC080625-04 TaxID=1096868 RepID=UPI0006CB8064|nr:hypothetical protein [Pseudonocardia sp. EC080625-04]ALE76791.1 hypothetical protein FRP1_28765 [Pseudonocardia sp. EC080625-04]
MHIEIHQTYTTNVRAGDLLPLDTIDRIRHDYGGVPARVDTTTCARVADVVLHGPGEPVSVVFEGGAVIEARSGRVIVVVREVSPRGSG